MKPTRCIVRLRSVQLGATRQHRNRGVFGLNLGHLWDERARVQPFMDLIFSELEAGRLTPVVARTFSLEQAADAHRYIQSRANIGKVVLTT